MNADSKPICHSPANRMLWWVKMLGPPICLWIGAKFLFAALDWEMLRYALILSLKCFFGNLGHHVDSSGAVLNVDSHLFSIDPDCTYIDLVLQSLPFLLLKRRVWASLGIGLLFTIAIMLGNFIRVIVAIEGDVNGYSWFLVHNLVDYLFWYPVFMIVVFGYLRRSGIYGCDKIGLRLAETSAEAQSLQIHQT